MADYTAIELASPRPGVTLITLNRPDRLNALSPEMIAELHHALRAIAEDRSCRVVVLTGAGRGFCSGIDIRSEGSLGVDAPVTEILRSQQKVAGLASVLHALPQPVIAAVNGAAAGGGFALALASDVRVCGPGARFNVAFVRIGLSGADIGVSYFLPRIVGLGLASELMMTGRFVDAEEAARIGLANRLAGEDDLLEVAYAFADELTANAPFGVRMTKQALAQTVDAPSLQAAIELENRTQALALQTDDMREALMAFLEKRPPDFQDR